MRPPPILEDRGEGEFCEVHGCTAPRCTLEEEGDEGSGIYDVECATYEAQFQVHLVKQGRLDAAYCPGCGRCAHTRVYVLSDKARAQLAAGGAPA